ncbi:uncharacterized protein ARMOST_02264 [Armillaria ostoyae]|uniref:Uncharacterized protein n=1 Tax=Armillaria ostoyae TaxID=47428 RepID=A0A284QRE3_ARMOS|nr:uncharacterized protein ARMOST_02264 [Armillaria ostoyae]
MSVLSQHVYSIEMFPFRGTGRHSNGERKMGSARSHLAPAFAMSFFVREDDVVTHPIAGGGSAKVFGEGFDVRRRRSSMLGLGVSVSATLIYQLEMRRKYDIRAPRLLSLALRATGDSGVNQSGEART